MCSERAAPAGVPRAEVEADGKGRSGHGGGGRGWRAFKLPLVSAKPAPRSVAVALAMLAALLAPPLDARAQPASKIYRIGVLANEEKCPGWEAFRHDLRQLGYVERTN